MLAKTIRELLDDFNRIFVAGFENVTGTPVVGAAVREVGVAAAAV